MSDALPAIDPLAFYGVAIALSVLLAVAEVGAAYRDTSHSPFRTILSLWAPPLYLLYALLTVLLGLVLIENHVLKPSWTGAILLGLAGPAIFRTRASACSRTSPARKARARTWSASSPGCSPSADQPPASGIS